MADAAEDTTVTRVGAIGVAIATNISGNIALAERLEAAQVQAIRECYDAGTTDPDTIRERMAAAREAVLSE